MNRIKLFLVSLLAALTGLWLLADTLAPQPFTYFSFRAVFVQYTGLVAIGAMSIAMLLAMRPRSVERWFGGLDKMYRLHKWLGVTALIVAVLHWWWAQGTKWMVGWGWLARPVRPRASDAQLGSVQEWLAGQRGLAESVGEWAFYAAAVLLVLALVRRFPYHLFAKTHVWLAAAYLVLAYHSLALAKFEYWMQPVGWALAALLLGGSAAAMIALTGRIGARRKVPGTIEAVAHFPGVDVLETRIALAPGWSGHAAGQFAFVLSDRREGAHPYTIASAWNPADPRITFITKGLGDHTRRLRELLKPGLPVTVEGPYGCFDFEDGLPRQIWIGAGIGITPFIARMKQLAGSSARPVIDLFHPTAVYEQAAIDKLAADAQAAGVRLHVLVDAKDGRLDGQRLRKAIPGWSSGSVWFCGPPRFGQALRADLVAHGLPPGRFHQELFQMR